MNAMIDTAPAAAQNEPVAATPATGFDRLNQRRVRRHQTAFSCPQTASRYGVVAGEAHAPAGFVGRSVNPRHHAAIRNDSRTRHPRTNEAPIMQHPYIAAVAVPLPQTADDIAYNVARAYWQPLGRYPDAQTAKAAVAAYIADHDHDACYIGADPAHPLYQRLRQRLGGAA